MATLEAVPHDDTASVTLTLSGLPSDDAALITRTDARGTVPVRLYADQVPSGGTLVIVDYEAELSGLVVYTAQQSGVAVAVADTELNVTHGWIASPSMPSRFAVVDTITRIMMRSAVQAQVHRIIGRADPIITTGPIQHRSGQIEVRVPTYVDVVELSDLIGEKMLFRAPPPHTGLGGYLVATAVSSDSVTDPGRPSQWSVTIDATEIAWPADDLTGALGWDYDDVTSSFVTFSALVTEFDTFDALAAG